MRVFGEEMKFKAWLFQSVLLIFFLELKPIYSLDLNKFSTQPCQIILGLMAVDEGIRIKSWEPNLDYSPMIAKELYRALILSVALIEVGPPGGLSVRRGKALLETISYELSRQMVMVSMPEIFEIIVRKTIKGRYAPYSGLGDMIGKYIRRRKAVFYGGLSKRDGINESFRQKISEQVNQLLAGLNRSEPESTNSKPEIQWKEDPVLQAQQRDRNILEVYSRWQQNTENEYLGKLESPEDKSRAEVLMELLAFVRQRLFEQQEQVGMIHYQNVDKFMQRGVRNLIGLIKPKEELEAFQRMYPNLKSLPRVARVAREIQHLFMVGVLAFVVGGPTTLFIAGKVGGPLAQDEFLLRIFFWLI